MLAIKRVALSVSPIAARRFRAFVSSVFLSPFFRRNPNNSHRNDRSRERIEKRVALFSCARDRFITCLDVARIARVSPRSRHSRCRAGASFPIRGSGGRAISVSIVVGDAFGIQRTSGRPLFSGRKAGIVTVRCFSVVRD